VTKQREAFEKWAVSVTDGKFPDFSLEGDEYWQLRTNTAWDSWQAAQADKLEFARRVAETVLSEANLACQSKVNNFCDEHGFSELADGATQCQDAIAMISCDAIIAKVEQGQ